MRKTEKSKQLFERAKRYFPGGVNSPVRAFKSVGSDPFMVQRGEGAYLIDVDGNRYVVYINSWGPLVLGHAHPSVLEALERQARLGTSFGACAGIEADLAELIMRFYPAAEMIRFVNSGTEAGMGVVRLARAATKRRKVLKFSGCYHGHADSFLVQAGSGVATLGLPNSPGVTETVAQDTLTAAFNGLDEVRAIFERCGTEIAAVILEPVVGNAGLIIPEPGFLKGLREITSQHGALLIFDEVMTGFRVALEGAAGFYDIRPDLFMLGKVIGGGLPVGAFGGKREIMEQLAPLGPVYQAGTLSGNPLAMAAGIATLTGWTSPGVFERAATGTREIVQAFRSLGAEYDIPLIADSVGTMFGFFFQEGPVRNFEDAKRSDTARFSRFFHAMLDEGVYFAPSQFEAGFVSIAHEGAPITETIAALERVLSKLP